MNKTGLVIVLMMAITGSAAWAAQGGSGMSGGMKGQMGEGMHGNGDMMSMPMMREHMNEMRDHMKQMPMKGDMDMRMEKMQTHMKKMQRHMEMMQNMMEMMHGEGDMGDMMKKQQGGR